MHSFRYIALVDTGAGAGFNSANQEEESLLEVKEEVHAAQDEDELPDLIDENEEEERELRERVKDLEWKWDELQRSRKELGITRM